MADPLSFAASVLIVIGAAGEVGKGLRLLKIIKDAPEGLDNLLEDVSRLELVLETVKNAASACQATLSGIPSLLEKAQERFAEIALASDLP